VCGITARFSFRVWGFGLRVSGFGVSGKGVQGFGFDPGGEEEGPVLLLRSGFRV